MPVKTFRVQFCFSGFGNDSLVAACVRMILKRLMGRKYFSDSGLLTNHSEGVKAILKFCSLAMLGIARPAGRGKLSRDPNHLKEYFEFHWLQFPNFPIPKFQNEKRPLESGPVLVM